MAVATCGSTERERCPPRPPDAGPDVGLGCGLCAWLACGEWPASWPGTWTAGRWDGLITESEKFSSAASAGECAPTGGRRLGERSRELGARGRLNAKSARGDGPAELPADEVGEGLAPDCSGVVGMAKGDGLRAPG